MSVPCVKAKLGAEAMAAAMQTKSTIGRRCRQKQAASTPHHQPMASALPTAAVVALPTAPVVPTAPVPSTPLPIPHLLLALARRVAAATTPVLTPLTHHPFTIKLIPNSIPGNGKAFTRATAPATRAQTADAARTAIRARPRATETGHRRVPARRVAGAVLVAAPVTAAAALDQPLRRVPSAQGLHFAAAELFRLVRTARQGVLDLAWAERAAVCGRGAAVAVAAVAAVAGGAHVFRCVVRGGGRVDGCGGGGGPARDLQDVERAACCRLDDVFLFGVVGHRVRVENVVVPVAGAGLEGRGHEAEGAFELRLGGGCVAGEREVGFVAVPGSDEVDCFAGFGGDAEGEV